MTMARPRRGWLSVAAVACLCVCRCGKAGAEEPETFRSFQTPQELLRAMIVEEKDSANKHERYEYLSNERSERTGGHLWTERVVETSVGKVRLLLAEDGKPLSAERAQQERSRLAGIIAHPEEFAIREALRMNDEAHLRLMLDDLPRAFLLENVVLANGVWHIDFRPNPGYSPSGIEERVLHGMSGWLAIDARDLRLVHIEARLPVDFSIGFGLLATIKAGSHFSSDRQLIEGHWRTVRVVVDIRGKAALFKSVGRSSDTARSEFHYLDPNITVAQAVELVEKQ